MLTRVVGRVSNNSLTNSKCIAEFVAARMASSNEIKICDIAYEIRGTYFIGITMNMTWKEKKIAT